MENLQDFTCLLPNGGIYDDCMTVTSILEIFTCNVALYLK